MTDDWTPEAVDYVQAIADTKLMLSHWYAEQAFIGPTIQDNIALFSLTQDEYGQVRQFFLQLEGQGRDADWLRSDRDGDEFFNAATTDEAAPDWTRFEVRFGLTDRAAHLMFDAIVHDDFTGLTDKMSEEEYSHFDFHDGWLEHLAEAEPAEFEAALEESLADVLAFIGPAAYDDETDPLVASGFTDRSVAELREAFLDHLAGLIEGTSVTVPDPDPVSTAEWDERRRRLIGGGIGPDVLETIRGDRNKEFAME
ncbi:phenylacetate-CoA oxygenase subunit PaaI (plasmid) [Halobaculum sp. CBA1158]|uniref:Phenylacetic acid catabolic protein n=1 Tax=Halobaculum sp. CBA1158 TaxID=2904243 RepID=UPI001F3F9969|nr:Phenylacetic acid catabolic protein [Halobaculum sp. CBA1158]UIP01494.1 phenylacetate-CoA oxygenase subunit PaaI [Halobaculum sp. CBA1158]